jgi:hypothetical protein
MKFISPEEYSKIIEEEQNAREKEMFKKGYYRKLKITKKTKPFGLKVK